MLNSLLIFLLLHGAELHQLYLVYSTGCTEGLVVWRFAALTVSHLTAAIYFYYSHGQTMDRNIAGLLVVAAQHALLYYLVNTYRGDSTLQFTVLGVLYVAVLCSSESVRQIVFYIGPVYTTAVKVYQLYCNGIAGSTGMLSLVSTLHVLLISLYYLTTTLPVTVRIIIWSCLITNGVQLAQGILLFDQTLAHLNLIKC